MRAVRICQRGLVREMIADRLVTCRAKLKMSPARKAGRLRTALAAMMIYGVPTRARGNHAFLVW
jgi:hypothetical protein